VNTQRNAVARIVTVVIAVFATAFAAASTNAEDRGIDGLPGSWRAEVSTPNQGSFPALITFIRDGGLIATESPGPFESPAHGNWLRRGRDVAFTFLVLFGTPAGAGHNSGSAKVVGTLHFDARGDGWSGPFRIQVFDAAGHVLFSDEGTIRLTRIEIEALD
jgi:hypothetical protein